MLILLLKWSIYFFHYCIDTDNIFLEVTLHKNGWLSQLESMLALITLCSYCLDLLLWSFTFCFFLWLGLCLVLLLIKFCILRLGMGRRTEHFCSSSVTESNATKTSDYIFNPIAESRISKLIVADWLLVPECWGSTLVYSYTLLLIYFFQQNGVQPSKPALNALRQRSDFTVMAK